MCLVGRYTLLNQSIILFNLYRRFIAVTYSTFFNKFFSERFALHMWVREFPQQGWGHSTMAFP